MNNTIARDSAPRLERSGARRVAVVMMWYLMTGVVGLIAAGTLNWPALWLLLAVQLLSMFVFGLLMLRHNPELLNQRGRKAENTKRWDKLLALVFLPLPFAQMVVAGLDHRGGWSNMPAAAQVVGLALALVAVSLSYWAMYTNAHFETTVRIQDDRGHRVITSGPYRIVRHPGYTGASLSYLGAALALGSWWALIPAALAGAWFVVRTALEDRTLRAELPGYDEYTQRTRYRLLPGVW